MAEHKRYWVTRVLPDGLMTVKLGSVTYRDRTLDGYIDQGETYNPNCMNYTMDADPLTVDDGTQTNMPCHRFRLIQDLCEANDEELDFDRWGNTGPPGDTRISATALLSVADAFSLGPAPAEYWRIMGTFTLQPGQAEADAAAWTRFLASAESPDGPSEKDKLAWSTEHGASARNWSSWPVPNSSRPTWPRRGGSPRPWASSVATNSKSPGPTTPIST